MLTVWSSPDKWEVIVSSSYIYSDGRLRTICYSDSNWLKLLLFCTVINIHYINLLLCISDDHHYLYILLHQLPWKPTFLVAIATVVNLYSLLFSVWNGYHINLLLWITDDHHLLYILLHQLPWKPTFLVAIATVVNWYTLLFLCEMIITSTCYCG